ncbi:response regulator [Candidatus Saccharibacteria bacterium]|nr:response regulator [Candidatus Saccharibacteria bacterium]NIW78659.1 response regulator [Calditrichia bacterium]
MGSKKLLVVDDDKTFQRVTKSFLEESGFVVDVVDSAILAEEQLRMKAYDLVLTDLVMAGKDGLEFLNFTKSWAPETPVVMITGFASVHSAVEAMKAGADDYLTKPCSSDELLLKIKRALEKRQNQQELTRLREEVSEKYTFENIVGKCEEMQAVFRLIKQVAETDAAVLIQGETGTGKELVAKAIHYNSLRKDKPFISVNCAALSETLLESELFGHERGAFTGALKQKLGRFELAHEGTLFLDEVGDIPIPTQAKLLRVLQEKEFERVGGTEIIRPNIRIISATNRNIKQSIAEETFREELFYRLNVMPIVLPALRKRQKDILLLAKHFLVKYASRIHKKIEGFSSPAMEMLLQYPWPGNVRELENVIERAVILCNGKKIEVNHLSYLTQEKETELLSTAIQKWMTEEQLTTLYARMILNEQKGNKKEACKILGINFRTLQNRLKE